jgi:hypothetical protein
MPANREASAHVGASIFIFHFSFSFHFCSEGSKPLPGLRRLACDMSGAPLPVEGSSVARRFWVGGVRNGNGNGNEKWMDVRAEEGAYSAGAEEPRAPGSRAWRHGIATPVDWNRAG